MIPFFGGAPLLFFFFIIGVMVAMIFLLIRVADLSRQVKRLEQELGITPRGPRPTYVPTTYPQPPPVPDAGTEPATPPGSPTTGSESPSTPGTAQPTPQTPPPTPARVPSATPAAPSATASYAQPPGPARPRKTRSRGEWEALIGERWLNRIGALALIIGIAFFLRHAFEQDWIGPTVRVLIGVAVGLIGVWLASTRRERYPVFSQGVLGAGIAVLYLSAFASFNFYSLISQPVAFLAMSAVTALTFERASRFDSLAVGLIGWAGGFLTPALLWEAGSPGSGDGLFIYLVALNIALVALTTIKPKRWWLLEPLSFFATWITYVTWFEESFDDSIRAAAVAFVLIIWALYLLAQVRKLVAAEPKRRALTIVIGGANAAFTLGALSGSIGQPYPRSMGAVALGFTLIYLGISMASKKTLVSLEVTAAAFLLLAIGFQFEDFVAVSLWAIEALALFWRGVAKDRRYLRFTGLAIYAISVLGLLVTDGALAALTPSRSILLANPRAAAFALVALAGLACASTYRLANPTPDGRWVPPTLHYLWGGLLFVGFTVETNDLYRGLLSTAGPLEADEIRFTRAMVLAVVWALFAVAMVGFSYLTEIRPAALLALGSLGLALALGVMRGITYDPPSALVPVINIRVLALVAIAGAVVVIMKLLDEMPEGIKELERVLGAAIAVLLFVLITGETKDFFQKQIAEVIPRSTTFFPEPVTAEQTSRIDALRNQQQLALSGVWLAYSLIAMSIGILRRKLSYRIASIVLFGITILKVFLFDLSFLDSIYRTAAFIGLGLILLLVSFLYQRYREVLFGTVAASPGGTTDTEALQDSS